MASCTTASQQRAVLDHYSPELLEGLLLVSAAVVWGVCALLARWMLPPVVRHDEFG